MEKLITITDIQEFKDLSNNLSTEKRLNMYIVEAQKFDIIPFLGDALYMLLEADFLTSPSLQTTKYEELFNGCIYQINGVNYRHNGIRSILCYYAFSRYLQSSKVISSAFGMVEKNDGTHSKGVTEKTLGRQVSSVNALADAEMVKVRKFMNEKYLDYPDWIYSNKNVVRPRSGVRISSIGGAKRKVGGSARCRVCGHYTCRC